MLFISLLCYKATNLGQTVNLAEFQGTKLKLIPRANRLPVDIPPVTPDDLFAPLSHNSKI